MTDPDPTAICGEVGQKERLLWLAIRQACLAIAAAIERYLEMPPRKK